MSSLKRNRSPSLQRFFGGEQEVEKERGGVNQGKAKGRFGPSSCLSRSLNQPMLGEGTGHLKH